MISLAVNVAGSVGLRGAARVLRLFFDWLGVEQATPTRTSIRNWLQRLGIAELQQPLEPNEDLVFMVDHSNQIGTEKVLVVLGVNASALPEPGNALKHEDVRVLEVKPGSQWKTENMKQEYKKLADRDGTPRVVLADGAVELRDGVKCLENRGVDTIVWLLRNPDATAREGISDQRMQDKLGWVEQYANDIAVWQECQDVVSASLKFINEQSLFNGAADGLRSVIGDSLKHDKSKELAKRLIAFVRDAEALFSMRAMIPGVSYIAMRDAPSSVLTFPTEVWGGNGAIFGPNLRLAASELSPGDFDEDGDTDGDDFLIWQSQFGSGSGSGAVVPEPATVALLLIPLCGALLVARSGAPTRAANSI